MYAVCVWIYLRIYCSLSLLLIVIHTLSSQPSTFISAVLLCTSIMLRLALPSIQVLTKVSGVY
ncbi:hypothetical protein EON63_21930 [archaeon]|nr:MAG: hypothetical protein EON63_21930 [archaeon]